MKKTITRIAIFCLAAGLAPLAARAAGPGLLVTPTGKAATVDLSRGFIVTPEPSSATLGKMTNAQGVALLKASIDPLSKVSTANVKITLDDQPLDRDVTGDNIGDFLNSLPSDLNPAVFDSDGSIMDALLGDGASLAVVSLAGSFSRWVTPTGKIVQAMLILNGRMTDGLFDPDDPAQEELTRLVVSAYLQMLNVGAVDLNSELIFDGDISNNKAVPLMYSRRNASSGFSFISADPPSFGGPSPANRGGTSVIGGGINLTLDDQMSLSALYPSTSFEANTGIIRGKVLLPDKSTGVQGMAVIARSTTDPLNIAVEAISGTAFHNVVGRGSVDENLRGAYEMHVPPGTYTLEFRPLREPIGPLVSIYPLPGGDQFYQTTPSPAAPSPTAAPPVPATATPVTVTAGQATEVNLVANGTPAPAPQTLTEVATPHFAPETAQVVPLSFKLTGKASPKDPGQIRVGGDKIEDLYRIVVPEPSILTMRLDPAQKVNLDLYIFAGILGGAAPNVVASANADSTDPETLQVALNPGTYTIGVSAFDGVQTPTETEYTLTVITTPLGDQPLAPRPVLDRLVVGNLTATSAEVSWVTDQPATGDGIVANPRQQFGDPTVAKSHKLAVTGLTAGSLNDLVAVSQVPGGRLDSLPQLFFRTASQTAGTGAAQVKAAVIGVVADTIGDGEAAQSTRLVAIAVQNSGGPATGVTLTGLAASKGWKLSQAGTDPLVVGNLGSGSTAVVVVRLLRDGTGTPPLPTVTGTVSLAGAGGAAPSFPIGP